MYIAIVRVLTKKVNTKKASLVQREVAERQRGRRDCQSPSFAMLSSPLRRAPAVALTVHRTVIHYHGDASLTLYTRGPFLLVCHSGGAHLQLELVGNEGDELRIGGLALGVGNGVAKEAL